MRLLQSAAADLWVQYRVKKKDFELLRVPGVSNLADILTKHVDRTILDKHLAAMNSVYQEGRAASAPSIYELEEVRGLCGTIIQLCLCLFMMVHSQWRSVGTTVQLVLHEGKRA